MTEMQAVFEKGTVTAIRKMIESGIDVNAREPYGPRFTPLQYAAKKCKPPIVKMLLSAGADPDAGNPSPREIAGYYGHDLIAAERIVKAEADAKAKRAERAKRLAAIRKRFTDGKPTDAGDIAGTAHTRKWPILRLDGVIISPEEMYEWRKTKADFDGFRPAKPIKPPKHWKESKGWSLGPTIDSEAMRAAKHRLITAENAMRDTPEYRALETAQKRLGAGVDERRAQINAARIALNATEMWRDYIAAIDGVERVRLCKAYSA